MASNTRKPRLTQKSKEISSPSRLRFLESYSASLAKAGQTADRFVHRSALSRLPQHLYCFGGLAGFLIALAGVPVEAVAGVWTKPSVSVWRNATRSSSSDEVNPSFPMVIFSLFGSSGIGQHVTFSTVPAGQCPESTG